MQVTFLSEVPRPSWTCAEPEEQLARPGGKAGCEVVVV